MDNSRICLGLNQNALHTRDLFVVYNSNTWEMLNIITIQYGFLPQYLPHSGGTLQKIDLKRISTVCALLV